MSKSKFRPANPLTLFKEGRKSRDSEFVSGIASEQIIRGGVAVYAWLLNGVHDQVDSQGRLASQLKEQLYDEDGNILIQDTIFMENRDRKYSENAVRLWGAYQVSQNALDFARYGIVSSDVLQMEFHKDDVERQCGRRLIPGDVIEMTHSSDVGLDGRPMNRWYEIRNIIRSPSGYDLSYDWHILAVTMRPIRDAQEFIDLMDRETYDGSTLGDQISDRVYHETITGNNQAAAFDQAYTTWWDIRHIYIDEETATPFIWTDDAVPPNGKKAPALDSFPPSPQEGDYVVRVDMYPNKLYRFTGTKWVLKEVDSKREWNTYNWIRKLREFASDGSMEDDMRPWTFSSIHDIQTHRQGRSNPVPMAKQPTMPSIEDWEPLISNPYVPPPSYNPVEPITYTTNLMASTSGEVVHPELNAPSGRYAVFKLQYSMLGGANAQIGEILITDTGNDTNFQHEYSLMNGSVPIQFSVRHDAGMRVLEYTNASSILFIMKFRVVDKW